MKKTVLTSLIIAALLLSFAGCGKAPAAQNPAGAAEAAAPAAEAQTAQSGTGETVTDEAPEASGRADGERFETVIMLEGMEETVRYEHVKSAAFGFEMDYDYENFVRQSCATGERFVSVWDDQTQPENYLEVSYDTADANLMADATAAILSAEYDIVSETRTLSGVGECLCFEASVIKGTNRMADQLQAVYIIPAPDGCRIARAHFSAEAAEGFGRRFAYMLDTLTLLDRGVSCSLTDEQALGAVRQYCLDSNPALESIVNAGEYPVSWEIIASDEKEIVVLFRSYTGSETRYYIDRATGETTVTEFVPGITAQEQSTDETLNLWEYVIEG